MGMNGDGIGISVADAEKKQLHLIKSNRNMSQKSNSSSFPILPLLGLVFVILKLCNIIDWSWWWVTLPFWVSPAIGFVYVITVVILKRD
jgi:hypothetical protein